MGKLTGHPVVDAIGRLNFEGDIIPKSWYKHIRYQNTKSGERADHLAVAILADIVYWYRPFQKRDELTGEVLGWHKKFKDDVLRRSPDAFAELLGTTPRCVRESMKLLENLGLIAVTRKPVKTQYGTIPNVMYITVVPDLIEKITYRLALLENAESTEKSLLRKWVTRDDEMGNIPLRNEEHSATKSVSLDNEISNSSIYRDLIEIKEITPQKEEGGVELNPNTEDPKPKSTATLITSQQSSHKPITPHEDINSAAPPLNHANDSFVIGRPQNAFKNCGISVASDPWMKTAKNPDPDFSQWVADKRYADKSKTPLADAKAEIRNNSDRASDLWDEYQSELTTKAEKILVMEQISHQEVKPFLQPIEQGDKYSFRDDPEYQFKATAMKERLAKQAENNRKSPCKTP